MPTTAITYRKYPESVRIQIARSGNPYLFPEYKIPRTTANHWIKIYKDTPTSSGEVRLLEKRLSSLERDLQAAKSLNELVLKVRVLHPSGFKCQRVQSKTVRRQILVAVRDSLKFNRVGQCLKIIGLPRSTYSRWLSEFFLCESIEKFCFQRKPHQLTLAELKVMKRLLTSKKYSHFSVASLCLWAQRQGELICSLDSWYKYLRIFGWVRPGVKKVEKIESTGIRASCANEIWHIDVTQVKMMGRKVAYVQAIYDNFSRYVLAWRITPNISAENTVALFEAAKKKASGLVDVAVHSVMSDGGPENNNRRVLDFLASYNVRRLIARVDVRFSNSMVESLFRMLKSNYLGAGKNRSLVDVARKVGFFFKQHNEVIPKVQLKGATPQEIYLRRWGESNVAALREAMVSAAMSRKASHQKVSCAACAG